MTDKEEYERGFVDGMQHQMKSSVDRAVNKVAKKEWVGLTDDEAIEIEDRSPDIRWAIIQAEDKLREKNA